jgi:hypothetical protein
MTRLLPAFFLLMALNACTPSNNTPPPTSAPKLIANSYSFSSAAGDHQTRDTFRFDLDSNLVSISYAYLNFPPPNQTIDSGTYYFTLDPVSKLPVSYILIGKKYFEPAAMMEKHELTYDGQNRVLLDSMTENNTSGYNPTGAHFIYSSNLVLVNIFNQGDADYSRQDSILFDNNGNWIYRSEYYFSGTVWSKENSFSVAADTKYAHPFYNAALSKSLGAFAIYSNISDLYSKNLTTSPDLLPITWVTDNQGRVVSGTNAAGDIIKYTYLK